MEFSGDLETVYAIYQCSFEKCKPFVLVYEPRKKVKRGQRTYWLEITEKLPFPAMRPGNLPATIPAHIREDITEASRCLRVDAFKGAACMIRRALHMILRDKGVEKKWSLKREINAAKSQGIIDDFLFELAQALKWLGDFGAHEGSGDENPDSVEDITEITPEDVSHGLDLVTAFTEALYVNPAKAKKLKEKFSGGEKIEP